MYVLHQEALNLGQGDGAAGKGTCCQAQSPRDRRAALTLRSSPLTFTSAHSKQVKYKS